MSGAFDYDYIVIGSGFGGSVSALRLSEKGYSVGVFETGKRWGPEDFPKTNMNLRKFVWMPQFFLYGIQQYTFLKNVFIAHGAGVGGGSLVYANTLLVPPSGVFNDPRWPTDEDWESKLSSYYDTAKFMLGAVEAKTLHPSDEWLREVVDEDVGGGTDTFRRHTVGVFYGDEAGKTVPDPYFGGEGPDRTGCIECMECQSGCKYNAKNTLDKNYLYLAEKRGAVVLPETKVVDIRPMDGGGYEIETVRSTATFRKHGRVFRCKGVVVSASVLGTVKLLLECKDRGSLPDLSDQLGNYVRTNAEAFGIVVTRDKKAPMAKGVTISAGVNTPDGTHFEAVRWGKGHEFLALLTTVFTGGGGKIPRWVRWLSNIARHPLKFLIQLWPWGWAQRSVVLMAMQPVDNYLKLKLKRGPSLSGLKSEMSDDRPIPAYMPICNEVTERLAKKVNGEPYSTLFDTVFNMCTTAHILGGATMGRDRESGVCDDKGRVFGYDNMFVADGSLVPANLAVNPSLTITALSEYVMSSIPAKDGEGGGGKHIGLVTAASLER